MAVTNLTNLTNSQDVIDVIEFANDATQQWLTISFIIAVYVILIFLAMRVKDFDESLTASSFACFVISIFLSVAKLLNFKFVIFFGMMTAIGAFWVYISNRN